MIKKITFTQKIMCFNKTNREFCEANRRGNVYQNKTLFLGRLLKTIESF